MGIGIVEVSIFSVSIQSLEAKTECRNGNLLSDLVTREPTPDSDGDLTSNPEVSCEEHWTRVNNHYHYDERIRCPYWEQT